MATGVDGQTRAHGRDLLTQLSTPLRSFLSTESGSAGVLLLATVLALAWANSPWSETYHDLMSTELAFSLADATLSKDLQHWVNDGLMVLFFFVIGLEVRREVSVGELTRPSSAVLPLLAGLGGMLVPVALYLLLNPSGDAARGWGVVIGTDTAFLLGALALVGPSIATQLRIFLLTLTVVDDIVAVAVIGVVYTDSVQPGLFLAAVACLVVLSLLSRRETWHSAPYIAVLAVAWWCTLLSGVHPSLTGMLAGLLIAARLPRPEVVEQAASSFTAFRQSPRPDMGRTARLGVQRAISPNERLQTGLHPWSSYLVVPLFAFVNAGIDLRDGALADALGSRLTWGVFLGLVLGKLVGIAAGVQIGLRTGAGRLPTGVRPGHVLGGAALSGIGFTVSLLIAGLAFTDEADRAHATVGVLLAAVGATVLGWLLFVTTRRRSGVATADLPMVLDRPVDPSSDHIRGDPAAPLTLVEYGDFQCPFCARATGVTRELADLFGSRLRYVFRHLPLDGIHPQALLAAHAAEAASRQDAFWGMHDLLFANQGAFTLEQVTGFADELGLDVEQFLDDLQDPQLVDRIADDVASAEASGARGTPTFFVADRRHVGPHDTGTLARALEAVGART
ncbi:MAG: Na+/H+ antiporter NhaA type [uncultured Nocardioidaceae bacterium]|uniref:Na(+)/H(+) antiporter NhaA n=1 Tax=uncultured Nocardioidaceae bacterium TaxID=253824 RepID=A0A6J4MX89_9ACTN|nr:MAG: Na+/H+ antiporter NhaA type [uncultured Nocardioidaceae bacterium]